MSQSETVTVHHTLGDILHSARNMLDQQERIQEVPVATPSVDRMMRRYDDMWVTTAQLCEQRATELETAAAELRVRANDLYSARSYLEDVKTTVRFEIESRQRADSLALVNPLPIPARELCGRRGGNCNCTTAEECIHQG